MKNNDSSENKKQTFIISFHHHVRSKIQNTVFTYHIGINNDNITANISLCWL